MSPDEDARYPRDVTSTVLTSVLTADDEASVGSNDVSQLSAVTSIAASLPQNTSPFFTLNLFVTILGEIFLQKLQRKMSQIFQQ